MRIYPPGTRKGYTELSEVSKARAKDFGFLQRRHEQNKRFVPNHRQAVRQYSNKIALAKNQRGIYSLDTSIGCASGMANEVGGCYNDCYAAKAAKLYGYDFSKTVLRYFENEYHRRRVMNQINRIPLDFVRIGSSGDPSENWDHTISILKQIDKCNKQIVIITRHWTALADEHLQYLSTINVCFNTSASALDKPEVLKNCLEQYERLKPYCKSILRIVSCEFNTENETGKTLSDIQHLLFKNEDTLDTVLRVNKNNRLAKEGIIKVKQSTFLGKKALISKFNKKTYFGKCSTCHEMCGIRISNEAHSYVGGVPLSKQLLLFTKNAKP